MKITFTLFNILVLIATLSAQFLDFEFFDTLSYQDGSFISPNTVLNDISDEGYIVGYYEDQNGNNAGLLVLPNGKYTSFQLSGYNHTELTGINNAGFVLGKAYNSANAAEVFQASIINGIVDQAVILTWNDPAGASKNAGKLNDDDVGIGSVKVGTQNWLHFESIQAPFTFNGTERYSTNSPFTTYNTYGLGLNNNAKYTAWYLDGVERAPLIYDGISDAFFPQAHTLPSVGGPRTYLNDINDNNYMAVSYRESNGQMQGTIGYYNGNSSSYDSNFPLISLSNFELLGINNNNDVVGYYQNASNMKVGIYLLADGPQIDGFALAEDGLLFANDSATFEYPSGTFDYTNTDPYLGISDTFYSKYIQNINFVLSAEQLNSIYTGKRNLSWPAFVRTREEDRAYITQSSGNKWAREEALIKWFENSNEEFQGNCYGMSLFALQNLSDPALLLSRFGSAYNPSANAIDYEADNLHFKEMLASLQLQQIALNLNQSFVMQNALNGALSDQNFTAIKQLMQPLIFEVVSGLKGGEADSSYIVSFRAQSANNLETFYHSVMPFKVTRNLTFGIPGDTLHCIDPNYPGNILDLYIDYNSGQSRAYVSGILVYFVDFAYSSSYLKNILPEIPASFMTNSNQNGPKNSAPFASYIHTGELCDFTIINLDNSTEQVSVQAASHLSTWQDMGAYYAMDQDDKMDKLIIEGIANISATISNCSDRNYYSYSHPAGMMIYERNNVVANEIDIVNNNGGFQSVQNPDPTSKTINLLALHSGSSSETSIAIKDYELLANEEVSIEVLDSTHILLSNNEVDDKSYGLSVSYVDGSNRITRNLENIALSMETNHTIVVQAAMEGQEVIILVDQGQDGIIEDTLFDILGPTSILNLERLLSFELYPNPTDNKFNIVFSDNSVDSYYLEIINGLGEVIRKETLDLTSQLNFIIDLGEFSNGFYMLKLSNKDGSSVANRKIHLH